VNALQYGRQYKTSTFEQLAKEICGNSLQGRSLPLLLSCSVVRTVEGISDVPYLNLDTYCTYTECMS
jgi:hypothetical protein